MAKDARGTDRDSRLRITVDDRERASGLIEALCSKWDPVYSGRLAVGDVQIGPKIIVERKTVADFVISLDDGRLFRQAKAMNDSFARPLLIVEGEDASPWLAVRPEPLRGALLTLLVAFRVPMLRSGGVEESALLLGHLAGQEQRRLRRQPANRPGEPRAARMSMEMLGVLPGVGDLRARSLLDRFGSVGGALEASRKELESAENIGPGVAKAIRGLADPEADSRAGPPPEEPSDHSDPEPG